MKRFIPTLCVLLFVVSFSTKAQYQSRYWKTWRYDIFGGIGTNNFMGDLGGGKKIGAHFFGVRDYDIQATRPTVSVGARMKLRHRMALKAVFSYARVNGNDDNTKNDARFQRNLSFSSDIWEGSMCLEFSILKENRGKRYLFQKRSILNNINAYFFAGMGVLHYEPKTKYQGKWVKLREMHTGGQGLVNPIDGSIRKQYIPWALAMPVGFGAKYYLNRQWSIGAEVGVRYTNTDYIDDASGRYFSNSMIREAYGDVAAALADRHTYGSYPVLEEEITYDSDGKYLAGGQFKNGTWVRGNTKYNDGYMFLLFMVSYTFKNHAKYGPKYQ